MSHVNLGLAQWHHPKWYPNNASSNQSLQHYCKTFSCVEGNTSFYAIPSEKNIQNWGNATHESFKFCFKFPKEISHKQSLTYCSRQVSEFLNRICTLNEKLGIVWLQLDQYFGAQSLDTLARFLKSLPTDFTYAVEVRNLVFFQKGEVEKKFNQLLQQYAVNRVIFDTRSLFANDYLNDTASVEAYRAKPRLPTHVLSTAKNPFVRIIVPMHTQLGMQVLQQWAIKVSSWLDEGLNPYVFFHTPDNAFAPEIAVLFNELLKEQSPQVKTIVLWDKIEQQTDLF